MARTRRVVSRMREGIRSRFCDEKLIHHREIVPKCSVSAGDQSSRLREKSVNARSAQDRSHLILHETKIARIARSLLRWACVLALACLQQSPALAQAIEQPVETDSVALEEPITPIPAPPALDPLKVKLGERLPTVSQIICMIRS